MEKVPLAQGALLVIDDRDALSVQDEKVLLYRFGVIAAVRLARLHDLDVDPGIRPTRAIGLELDERGSPWGADCGCVGEIDHERLVDRSTLARPRVSGSAAPRIDSIR